MESSHVWKNTQVMVVFKGFLRIPFKLMKTKMCCFHEDFPEMFIKSSKRRGPADVQFTFAKRLLWCVRGLSLRLLLVLLKQLGFSFSSCLPPSSSSL